MKITAAVCRAPKQPLIFEELDIDDPRDDEVLVKVHSVGICHTDIAMRDQVYPVPHPIVLGHEGAGTVEKVGKAVTGFAPGDPVLMSFDACGRCVPCAKGVRGFCKNFFAYNFAGARQDGSTGLRNGNEVIHSNFFGQSSFASHALATPRNLLKLESADGLEFFGPLGCGIQTGAGAVLNALKVGVGDSFVVFGIGSVALSAVMAARAAGASTIIAVGRNDKKLELAKEVGATHVVNSTKAGNVVQAVRALTGGEGVGFSLDTTAVPAIIRGAIECLDFVGKCAILGAAPPGTMMELDSIDLMTGGKTLMGTVEGNCVPQEFIPRLIALYRQGRFPIDKLATFYPFEKINDAIADCENGKVIKAILRM